MWTRLLVVLVIVLAGVCGYLLAERGSDNGDKAKPAPPPAPTPAPTPTPTPTPTPKPSPTLERAWIKFTTPDGDDKDHDTGVAVDVYSKAKGGFDLRIAGKAKFAGNKTFEDTGSEHTEQLDVSQALAYSDVGSLKVRIQIYPNGNDTWIFDYKLGLEFSDGKTLEKAESGIRLNQNDRVHPKE